ncbi:MAG TPA: hypothetical protein VGW34_02690 [Allosphingosinicella sp.]|nr:hypothetical protein [Allosphingosinicella sp.]
MLMAAAPPAETGLAPARLWALARRRWPLLAAIVAATTSAAFLYSTLVLARDPVYEAAATLDISPSPAEIEYAGEFVRNTGLHSAAILTQTYAEYAMSRPVLASVADEYIRRVPGALAPQPERGLGLRRLWNALNYGTVPRQNARAALIEELAEATRVATVNGTYLLRIEVEWDNPVLAAWIANQLTERLMAAAAIQSELPVDRLNRMLAERLQQTRATLEGKQAQAVALRGSLGIADIPAQKQAIIEERLAEEARLTNEQALMSASAAQVGVLQRQAEGKLSASLPAIDQALALERPRLAGLRQGASQRRARIAGLNAQLNRVARAEATISALDRDIAVLQAEATALAERASQVQLDRMADGPTIRVVERATPPLVRDSPKVMVNTAMGFIAGCALAGMVLLLAPGTTVRRTRTTRSAYPDAGPRVYPGLLRAPRSGRSFTARESRDIKARLEAWLAEPLMQPGRPLYVLGADGDADATAVFNLVRAFLQSRGEQVTAASELPQQLPAAVDDGDRQARPMVYCGGLGETGEIPVDDSESSDLIVVKRNGSGPGGSLQALQSELRQAGWRDPYLIRIAP